MLRRSFPTMTMIVLVFALPFAGCGTSDESPSTTSDTEAPQAARTSGKDGPAATGGRSAMQVTDITVTGNRFDPARIEAKAGVVTLRLRNASDKPLRLALREGRQLLTEGGPASGKQVSEITVPVEAGKTYEYFTAGNEKNGLLGRLEVAD